MKQYRSATPWPIADAPPNTESKTSVPARAASFQADVLVPMGQALVTGILVGTAIAIAIAAIARMWVEPNLTHIWLGSTMTVVTVAWVTLLTSHRKLLWAVERLTHKDLDGDGNVGKLPVSTINVQVQDGNQVRFVDGEWLELTDAQLMSMAEGMVQGRRLTEAAWGKDRITFPGGINEFRAVREKLVTAGLVRRSSGARNASYELTAAGRTGFEAIHQAAHVRSHTHG